MKIITQNIRSFNPIINSAKQRKTDKFKKIEILLKEEKPDIAILTETRHYKEETDRTEKAIKIEEEIKKSFKSKSNCFLASVQLCYITRIVRHDVYKNLDSFNTLFSRSEKLLFLILITVIIIHI